MRFIIHGAGEVGRKIRRIFLRSALRRARRNLENAEIELGRFAWKEAEGVAGVWEEFKQVQELEQKQTALADQIQELEDKIEGLRAEQTANRESMKEELARLESEHQSLVTEQEQAVREVSRRRNEVVALDKQMRQLDQEQESLLREYADLQVANPPPASLEARLKEIQDRRAGIPDERADVVHRRLQLSNELSPVQEELALLESKIALVEKQLSGIRSEQETKDRSLADIIRTYQAEIGETRKRSVGLEREKNAPYLALGHRLADRDIALKERPELMETVRDRRLALQDQEDKLNASLAASQGVKKSDLRRFYLLLAGLILAVILLIWLASTFQKLTTPPPEAAEPRAPSAAVVVASG